MPTSHHSPHGRARVLGFALGGVSLLSVIYAVMLGPYPIAMGEVLSTLFTGGSDANPSVSVVVWDIRLSRICLSWLAGVALGVCGVVFQGLLRNPLADPFTLGVSSGAAFGATLAIYLGVPATFAFLPGVSALPVAGLLGAVGALLAVIMLGRSGGMLKRETLVLAGIVVATFLAALISLLKSLDEDSVAAIVFWIMGSFQGRGWADVFLLLPYMILGLAIIWRFARELDILSLGDVQARQLGVNVDSIRMALLISASLLTGATVAVSGVIGFVGLLVPHLVRLLQGGEHRPLLINSGLLGGVLLLWSDTLARTILPEGAELPVGVVTALLGGPFFCVLLRKKAKGLSA